MGVNIHYKNFESQWLFSWIIMKTFILYVFIFLLLAICLTMISCGASKTSSLDPLKSSSKGYVLYVFSKKTEVMIDYCKSDGISNGTRFDIFRTNVNTLGIDEPVKLGEITIDKVGDKMSRAKITAFTSSLQIERGDKVFPHPVTIITDGSWMASKIPTDGWKSNPSLPKSLDWVSCQVLPESQLNAVPEIKQFAGETGAKPIWHSSNTSHQGNVYFRNVFTLDTNLSKAKLTVLCSGKTNIYLNDAWVGETKDFPEISEFTVHSMLRPGRNVIGIHATRSPREKVPPLLFAALVIQTEFR